MDAAEGPADRAADVRAEDARADRVDARAARRKGSLARAAIIPPRRARLPPATRPQAGRAAAEAVADAEGRRGSSKERRGT